MFISADLQRCVLVIYHYFNIWYQDLLSLYNTSYFFSVLSQYPFRTRTSAALQPYSLDLEPSKNGEETYAAAEMQKLISTASNPARLEMSAWT